MFERLEEFSSSFFVSQGAPGCSLNLQQRHVGQTVAFYLIRSIISNVERDASYSRDHQVCTHPSSTCGGGRHSRGLIQFLES